ARAPPQHLAQPPADGLRVRGESQPWPAGGLPGEDGSDVFPTHAVEGRMKAAGTPVTAPPLSVRGLSPGEVTIAGLTAGGVALLLFVNEDCPTSAMAMRRLGPLCPAWQAAGLTATDLVGDTRETGDR